MQMRFHPEWAGLHLTYFLFAIFYTIKVIQKTVKKYFISVTTHIFFLTFRSQLQAVFSKKET